MNGGTDLNNQPASTTTSRREAAAPRRGRLNWTGFMRLILTKWLRILARSIPLMLLIFCLCMVLHTFLLVYYNEGFGDSTLLGRQVLNIQDSALSSTLLWMMVSGLAFGILPVLIKKGPGGFSAELRGVPQKTAAFLKENSSVSWQLFLTGLGLTMIIASIMSASTNLVLALSALAILALPLGSVLAALIQSTWAALLQILRPEHAENLARFGLIPGYLMIAGTITGLVLGTLLPLPLFLGMIALITAAVLILVRKQPPDTVMRILFALSLAGYVIMRAEGLLADDGGWIEAGSTWEGWVKSEGATEAVVRGLGPSIGAALGPSLLGTAAAIDPDDFGDDLGDDDPVLNNPHLLGNPDDHPFTDFVGGDGPGACHETGLPNYWVNTATLNLVVRDVVFVSSGLGPEVRLVQTYNTAPGAVGMFGRSWHFSYESTVEQQGENVVVCRGSGQRLRFRPGVQGTPAPLQPAEAVSLDGRYERLVDHGDCWLFMEKASRLFYKYRKIPGSTISNLVTIHDLNGNQIQLNYNPDGTLAEVVDAAGRITGFVHSGRLCTAITVPDGRTATYAYDEQGNMIQAVDLLGVTANYEYDADGYLVRMIVGRERRTTSFSYRKRVNSRQLAAITDAAGNTGSFEMVADNPYQVRAKDREGQITHYHTSNGCTQKVIDPLGNSCVYEYAGGLPVSFTDQNGATARMEWDPRGNLTRYTDRTGGVATGVYDSFDNLITFTNPLGASWVFAYDKRRNLTGITSPAGRVQRMEYDARGQLLSISNSAGVKSGFEYDGFGNLSIVNYPLGNTIQISYDRLGLRNSSQTDSAGNTTAYEYDLNGRLTRRIHPEGSVRIYGYDCCAGIFTTDENACTVAYERDPLINITAYHDALGNITAYGYDRNSRLVSSVDAAGRSLSLEYDAAGRMVHLLDPSGQSAEFKYDSAGNLILIKDQCGQQISFGYDACGRLVKTTDYANNAYALSYDRAGNISLLNNARGETIGFEYDPDGQVIGKTFNGKAAVACAYDEAGNLTRITDATGSTNYKYNAARQVESIEYADGLQAFFSYTPSGSLNSVSYPGDLKVSYEYDQRSRLIRMAWGRNEISFAYDAVGNLIQETRSNGTESAYAYNANYQLESLKHMKARSAFIDIYYRRDVLGNIIEESGLKPVAGPGLPGKKTAVKASYNRLNQLLTWNNDVFSYDADGNLTAISGSRQFSAGYDGENRLVNMESGGRSFICAYNGLNQRIRTESPGQIRNYHYSPDGLLLFATDGEGQIVSRFLYSGNRLAAMLRNDGSCFFYHFDQNGSTLVISGDSGTAAAAYDYSPFGEVIEKTGNLSENIFTYTGAWGVVDDGDGWFFMKHRCYDSITGRFIQKDPIGICGGYNLYAYVHNNPITSIDPEGTIDPATLTGILILITFAAAAYTAGRAAERFGNKNPLTRTLNTAPAGNVQQNTAAHGPNPADEYWNHPQHGMNQVVTTTGDKILTTNPITSPAWSGIKAGNSLMQGNPGEAALNATGVLPGNYGAAGTAAGEVYGVCTGP